MRPLGTKQKKSQTRELKSGVRILPQHVRTNKQFPKISLKTVVDRFTSVKYVVLFSFYKTGMKVPFGYK